jgi:hypothetical protein
MNSYIRVPLNTNPEQFKRLLELQETFAQVCNELAPEVKASKVWNRVALHHMHYRRLREKFPSLGSQMVCNAIYAVSRTARLLFQTPASPYHLSKLGAGPLPLMHFASSCPVYFDRHTLSVKGSGLSLFTLDGRMHFDLKLPTHQLMLFQFAKLREISLKRSTTEAFELLFWLEVGDELTDLTGQSNDASSNIQLQESSSFIPEYVSLEVVS